MILSKYIFFNFFYMKFIIFSILLLCLFANNQKEDSLQQIIGDYKTNNIYTKKHQIDDFIFNSQVLFNKIIKGGSYILIDFNDLEQLNKQFLIQNVLFNQKYFDKKAFFDLNSKMIYLKDNFFVNSYDKSSFTMTLSFKPVEYFDKNIIFKKKNTIVKDEIITSQEIIFFFDSQGFFYLIFDDIFQFQGEYIKVVLKSKDRINLNSWYFLQVYYDAIEGEIGFFLNGRKQQVKKTILKKDSFSMICSPLFFEKKILNQSRFILGSKYIGYLENVIFFKDAVSENLFVKSK